LPIVAPIIGGLIGGALFTSMVEAFLPADDELEAAVPEPRGAEPTVSEPTRNA
jgi:glycerol uptake facilitator protein